MKKYICYDSKKFHWALKGIRIGDQKEIGYLKTLNHPSDFFDRFCQGGEIELSEYFQIVGGRTPELEEVLGCTLRTPGRLYYLENTDKVRFPDGTPAYTKKAVGWVFNAVSRIYSPIIESEWVEPEPIKRIPFIKYSPDDFKLRLENDNNGIYLIKELLEPLKYKVGFSGGIVSANFCIADISGIYETVVLSGGYSPSRGGFSRVGYDKEVFDYLLKLVNQKII